MKRITSFPVTLPSTLTTQDPRDSPGLVQYREDLKLGRSQPETTGEKEGLSMCGNDPSPTGEVMTLVQTDHVRIGDERGE